MNKVDTKLPVVVEPELLEQHLQDPQLLVIDLSKHENHLKYHIPGAIHLDYSELIRIDKPAMGLLPDINKLNKVFSAVGINENIQVVAYDDEGGGKAARLLWTLDTVDHPAASMLNGGIFSWANEGHPLSHDPTTSTPTECHYSFSGAAHVNKDYIVDHLNDDHIALLDTRTPEEYAGVKKFAARAGHIPGAVNIDWILTMDQSNNLKLLSDTALTELLESRGISKDKQVIVYCQTHHRSSHTYVVLKHLGYPDIKGYAGAWSDWGNCTDTPIEM